MAKKILIVDDEPNIIKVIASRLKANGYETISAQDGEEALSKVGSEKPDLILLDVAMPKMDGYTFMRTLKAQRQDVLIPVIVVTAKAEMKDLFVLEGVRGYVVKPFEMSELLSRIKDIIGTP